MNQNQLIEQIVKNVLQNIDTNNLEKDYVSFHEPIIDVTEKDKGKNVGLKDYPLGEKRPEILKTPTNKDYDLINLVNVINGKIGAEDLRISPETLEMQAKIADEIGREAFARNLRRAAELICVPDERILQIYNAIRPYRSTKKELLNIADELENIYNATINANFIREVAHVYQLRDRLKRE